MSVVEIEGHQFDQPTKEVWRCPTCGWVYASPLYGLIEANCARPHEREKNAPKFRAMERIWQKDKRRKV